MGRAKEEMMRQEGLYFTAINLLEETGAVSRCEFHEEFYSDNGDEDALKHAYALGTIWVRDGKVDGEREEFMTAIKAAYDDAGYDCPACENHRND
jgi:hypothetical protein